MANAPLAAIRWMLLAHLCLFSISTGAEVSSAVESAPADAVRVTNVEELRAAIALPAPKTIALATGIYDFGEKPLSLTDPRSPGEARTRLLGGFDPVTWTRPAQLPSVDAPYDPQTGLVQLPERLKKFLATGAGETVFLRDSAQWIDKVGENVFFLPQGTLDRITCVGPKNPNTDQATCFTHSERATSTMTDCMFVQRFSNSHSYLATPALRGAGATWRRCIFYMPFVGQTGNSRPQILLGSNSETPAKSVSNSITLDDCTFLLPINGGYHRLNLIAGSILMKDSQFISAHPDFSRISISNARNVCFVDESRTPLAKALAASQGWRVEFQNSEFVVSHITTEPWRLRALLMENCRLHVRFGFVDSATLWADQGLTIPSSTVIDIEHPEPLWPPVDMYQGTPASRLTTALGGTWTLQTVTEENVRVLPVLINGTGAAPVLAPTVQQKRWAMPVYEGLKIDYAGLMRRLELEGEGACPAVFEEHYPLVGALP